MQFVHGKNSSRKSGKKWEKKTKIGKSAVDLLNFGEIFQSFRKSYFLVPSDGGKIETKIRRKPKKKKTLAKGFSGNRRENITKKKSEFWGKKKHCRRTVSEISESLKKIRISKLDPI